MSDSVPVAAVHDLLALLPAQGLDPDVMAWLQTLIEPATAASVMRRFKLDVSVDLSPDATPRMSINDTGEPELFRRRLRSAAPQLGLDPTWLEELLSISAPGDGQTTLGIKWLAQGLRSTIYFEELPEHSDPVGCRAAMHSFFGLAGQPADGPGVLGAVGVDVVAGAPVALKEYRMAELGVDQLELGSALQAFADGVPSHPRTGRCRAIVAQRVDRGGGLLGRKLIWMTEARSADEATATWPLATSLVRACGAPIGPNLERVLRLVEDWPWSASCFPYPDLVSFDVDPSGAPRRAILYVSIR